MTWVQLKRYIHSTNLSALFFATFSTMVVIISTNIIPSIADIDDFRAYFNYSSIIYILILFFFSSVFWFLSVLIYEIFVPDEIATYLSADQFVDAAISSPLYDDASARLKIGTEMSKKWHEIDHLNFVARASSAAFAIIAAVSYSTTVVFLFFAIWKFLANYCLLLQLLPFLDQLCS